MRDPYRYAGTLITAAFAPAVLHAVADLTWVQSVWITNLILLPAFLMEAVQLVRFYRKVRTVHAPDLSERITIPFDVLACTRAPTLHEQIELIRRLRESQQQLIQLSGGE